MFESEATPAILNRDEVGEGRKLNVTSQQSNTDSKLIECNLLINAAGRNMSESLLVLLVYFFANRRLISQTRQTGHRRPTLLGSGMV